MCPSVHRSGLQEPSAWQRASEPQESGACVHGGGGYWQALASQRGQPPMVLTQVPPGWQSSDVVHWNGGQLTGGKGHETDAGQQSLVVQHLTGPGGAHSESERQPRGSGCDIVAPEQARTTCPPAPVAPEPAAPALPPAPSCPAMPVPD